jgi:hypothetical protein
MEHKFSQQIFETYSESYFTKIHPVGTELYHAERQTGMMKLCHSSQFSAMPKNLTAKEN